MTEQKDRHRKRDEKLQHRDDRCLLGWGGWVGGSRRNCCGMNCIIQELAKVVDALCFQ